MWIWGQRHAGRGSAAHRPGGCGSVRRRGRGVRHERSGPLHGGRERRDGILCRRGELSLAIASVTDATPENPRPIRGAGWELLPVPIAWCRKGCPRASCCRWTTCWCGSTAPRAMTVRPQPRLPCPSTGRRCTPMTTDALNALGGDLQLSVSGQITIDLGGYVLLAGGFAAEQELAERCGSGRQRHAGRGSAAHRPGGCGSVRRRGRGVRQERSGPLRGGRGRRDGILCRRGEPVAGDCQCDRRDAGDPATDTRRWLGIVASADSLGPEGLPEGFVLQVDNLLVRFNSASGDDGTAAAEVAVPIDWSALYTDTTDALNALSGDLQLSVSGQITIDLGGYVLLAGGFAAEQELAERCGSGRQRHAGRGSAAHRPGGCGSVRRRGRGVRHHDRPGRSTRWTRAPGRGSL